jgi:hypothetical protein
MAHVEKSNVSELNTDLVKQVAVLREDIASLMATVAEYSKAQSAQMKSKVEEKAAHLRHRPPRPQQKLPIPTLKIQFAKTRLRLWVSLQGLAFWLAF